jgi:cell shape-determining protein MreC
MAKSTYQATAHPRALAVSAAILALLSVLPARWGGWVGQFGALTEYLVAPAASVVTTISGYVRRPRETRDDALVRELETQRDQFQAMYLQQRELVEQLQRQLDEYRAGESELGLKLLTARVVGPTSNPSAGVLILKAGARHGVENGTVASVAGTQIVGRVEEATADAASLLLITARAAGPIDGAIVRTGSDAVTIPCRRLHPQGDGTLRGYVEYVPAKAGEEVKKAITGDVVRLSDAAWPANAQMLVIGVVDRIDAALESPLRQIITVRPTARLERVTEVTLRLTGRPGTRGRAP